jgi:hypothetical protein
LFSQPERVVDGWIVECNDDRLCSHCGDEMYFVKLDENESHGNLVTPEAIPDEYTSLVLLADKLRARVAGDSSKSKAVSDFLIAVYWLAKVLKTDMAEAIETLNVKIEKE